MIPDQPEASRGGAQTPDADQGGTRKGLRRPHHRSRAARLVDRRRQAEFGFDKRQMIFRTKIEKLEPGKQVVWSCHGEQPEWNGTVLTWDIARDGNATILRFTQGGWKSMSEMYAICNSSWGELMHRLRDYAEGKRPGPHWKE